MNHSIKKFISENLLVAMLLNILFFFGLPSNAVIAAGMESFFDGFENGFGKWLTEAGTPSQSMARIHNGKYSYSINEDNDAIKHTFAEYVNKVAVVWFYDDADDTSMRTLAFADGGNTVGIGVDTSTSVNKYIYRTGSTFTASNITRITGWHQLVFDYRSGTDVKLYIDQSLLLTTTVETRMNRIALGDYWNNISGTVYFDDVSVQDTLPWTPQATPAPSPVLAAFKCDGFENGFSYWSSLYGSQTTDNTTVHRGSNSYKLTSDLAAIQYTNPQDPLTAMPKIMNKVATVWFYDDASDTDERVMAFADRYVALSIVGLGVNTSVSQNQYVYRIGSKDSDLASGISRTTGWHELIFDYRSGSDLKLYIDGTLVCTSTKETSFSRIGLGDWWGDGNTSTAYFDDVKIQDTLPWEPAGFEDGFRGWTAEHGTPDTSTAQVHEGLVSYIINEDRDVIKYTYNTQQNNVVTTWFYDDAADLSMHSLAFVDGVNSTVGLGVNTDTSSSSYICRVGSAYTATSITRSTGWHEMVFDYTSGVDVKLYIDRSLVLTSAGEHAYTRIALGDYWTGQTGIVYYDDIRISKNLPWVLFKDSFENGIGNWTASVGTATTSAIKAYNGNYSYNLDEDKDVIQYNTSAQNKVAIIWFYDDASDNSMNIAAFCDNTTNVAISVNTGVSATKYSYRLGTAYVATDIPRTTGWHQFVFDYTSGYDCKVYIDQIQVLVTENEISFKRIGLGDWWNNQSGNVYFDEISIEEKLPWASGFVPPPVPGPSPTPTPIPTPTPTPLPIDASSALGFEAEKAWQSEAYLLEDNSFSESQLACSSTSTPTPIPFSVLNEGVSQSTQHVQQGTYSGKWANHPFYPSISTRNMDKDWSNRNMISFSIYSEENTGEEISLLVYSDNPATTWKEFFYDTFKVDWTGWKRIEIPLAAFTSYGNTQGWNSIQEIRFSTKIFDREPNPYTVLYLDDMQLTSETPQYLEQVIAARPGSGNDLRNYITKCPQSLESMSFEDFLLFVHNKLEYTTASAQRQQEIDTENAGILAKYSIVSDIYSATDFVDTMPKIDCIYDNVPFDEDIMNHNYPVLATTPQNPLQYQTYWKSERALYGYYPDFNVSPVTIAPDGNRYIKYGSSVIEVYNDEKSKWYYMDLEPVYKAFVENVLGWTQYRQRSTGQMQAPQIRFDNSGDAYITAVIQKVNSDGTFDTQPESYAGLLLYSHDKMKTWQVYRLPCPLAKMETTDAHNPDALSRPPVIVMAFGHTKPTDKGGYILIPEKQSDGTLVIPQATKITDSCFAFETSHSGDANVALTVGNSVYITYGVHELENCPEIPENHSANSFSWVFRNITYYSRNGTPSFIVEYNITTKEVSQPLFLGYGGHAVDSHNGPGISFDTQGYIHAIVNGHHDPIYYTSSTNPNSISSWNAPVLLSNGNTYTSLIIDNQDNIYLVNRNSEPGAKFDLSMTRKKAGQNWENTVDIVSRIKSFYEVWTHKMTIDQATGKLYLTYYGQSLQTEVYKDEYDAYMYVWPDREVLINPSGSIIPVGTVNMPDIRIKKSIFAKPSEMCTLVSEDGGDTWHLATSSDY